jgi:hypothetical protein
MGADRPSSDEAPPRDTPGSRAARAAAPDDSNPGQRKTPPRRSRLDSLPVEEQAAVQQAAKLLALLQRIATPDRLSPGEQSSAMAGGRRLPPEFGRAA